MFWHNMRYPRSAAGWVVKLSTGPVDERTWLAFGRWLDGKPTRTRDFQLHAATWQLASTLEANTAVLYARDAVARYRPARWARWPALAAATTVAFLLIAVFPRSDNPSHIQTGFGETRRVALADGSVMYLNTDTVVDIEMAPARRRVVLARGEAFFEVAHDAARPFNVIAGDRQVTAVGTRFSVKTLGKGVEVSVAQGVVAVDDATDDTGKHGVTRSEPATRLTAGAQYIQADERRPGLVRHMEVERVASWRLGRLIFDQTTVGRVVDEMNRYSARKLIIEDADIRDLKLGGTFAMDDSETVAFALRDIYGLKLRTVESNTVISR